MSDKPETPAVDTDPKALEELAQRENEGQVVDQQTAASAAAGSPDNKSGRDSAESPADKA